MNAHSLPIIAAARPERLGTIYAAVKTCDVCEGHGSVHDEAGDYRGSDGWFEPGMALCETCDGQGTVPAVCECCGATAPCADGGETACAKCGGELLIATVGEGLFLGGEAVGGSVLL